MAPCRNALLNMIDNPSSLYSGKEIPNIHNVHLIATMLFVLRSPKLATSNELHTTLDNQCAKKVESNQTAGRS